MKTITKHYIDGALIETHGREVVDIVNPTRGKAIARMTLGRRGARRRGLREPRHTSNGRVASRG